MLNLLRRGKLSAAIKQLDGHGLAEQTPALADLLQKEFRPRSGELPEGLLAEELKVTLTQIKTALFQACSAGSDSCDGFQLKTNHLFHVRGTKFFTLLARYTLRLLKPGLPQQVALIEKSAAIFGANKVSEATQMFLVENRQKKKIRGISSSGLLLKTALKVAAQSEQAQRTKRRLQDSNVSMGKKSGPELIALVAKAAVRTNSFILLVRDGEKAFPNLSRNRVHSLSDSPTNTSSLRPGADVLRNSSSLQLYAR